MKCQNEIAMRALDTQARVAAARKAGWHDAELGDTLIREVTCRIFRDGQGSIRGLRELGEREQAALKAVSFTARRAKEASRNA